ncbi:PREDICTED: putative F-box protein At1g65770 [Nicotiana attenuata]|uniref:putative F-box protein At1g65770 n=1 Tax=Nicotiana attenuata TaxID=49451 RepID=UPI00090553B0|nr:PREDICTED: putative F-box protein At1g65770 [Nicotiana attenuata]
MILKKRIPGASGKRCVESMGWLITVGKDEGEISLLHPFSGVQIELPHQNTTKDYYELNDTEEPWAFIRKAVLSANPSQTSDYVLMVIEGPNRFLSFWRPGDLLWTRIGSGTSFQHVSDVVYFDGLFYTVAYGGCVYVCDVAGFGPAKTHFVAKLPRDPDAEYSVKWTYQTTNIQVFQVDLAVGKMIETRDLGDRAFFLGANASLSVQASQFPGIKCNHIYFTDNCLIEHTEFEEGGGSDMGVFNLADGSFQPHYEGISLSRVCPPLWVTPTLR